MWIFAVIFLIGLGCGLRLGLALFLVVMAAVFAVVVASWSFGESPGVLGSIAQIMVAALSLQTGYAGGLLIRAYTE